MGRLTTPHHAMGVVLIMGHDGRWDEQALLRSFHDSGLGTAMVEDGSPVVHPTDSQRGDQRIGESADGLRAAAERIVRRPALVRCPVGILAWEGAVTAALVAAAREPGLIKALVCVDGRPDLASDALPRILCPTLFVITALGGGLIQLHRQVKAFMEAHSEMEILDTVVARDGLAGPVAQLARQWFVKYLK